MKLSIGMDCELVSSIWNHDTSGAWLGRGGEGMHIMPSDHPALNILSQDPLITSILDQGLGHSNSIIRRQARDRWQSGTPTPSKDYIRMSSSLVIFCQSTPRHPSYRCCLANGHYSVWNHHEAADLAPALR
jgi:hypothetical protein